MLFSTQIETLNALSKVPYFNDRNFLFPYSEKHHRYDPFANFYSLSSTIILI